MSIEYLASLQREHYRTNNLVNVSPDEFKRRIDEFSSMDDTSMEGYQSDESQRTRSIRFEWAEDQDFGTFSVNGMSKGRATFLLANFIDQFGVLPRRLDGYKVLDVGCWTGAASCLMAAMGAEVIAVEEVKKYVECLNYLRDAFEIENLTPINMSLYDLTADEFQDAFDFVLFGGVLYHLSDPIIGMRITFNVLKPGGVCMLETAVARSDKRICEYAGKDEANRGAGANWFFPTPPVVDAMMEEVGYQSVRHQLQRAPNAPHDRVTAVGRKVKQVDMLRAGLSVPDIR
jgi:2-polyprenyl-3-methyl-5-hydroxy-6-metoxy-1,4-benzoquinol methylase